jgi:hypothetical protein
MNRKRNPSKDRFRAGRRLAQKAAQKFLRGQMVFPWFDKPRAVSSAKDPAPGQLAFEWFIPKTGRAKE